MALFDPKLSRRRGLPLIASIAQSDRRPSPGGRSVCSGVSVTAILDPSGEHAGQIQLDRKSRDRLWVRQEGGADVSNCWNSLSALSPPPATVSVFSHQDTKSAYGRTGSNTLWYPAPDVGAAFSAAAVLPGDRWKNSTQFTLGDHPTTSIESFFGPT